MSAFLHLGVQVFRHVLPDGRQRQHHVTVLALPELSTHSPDADRALHRAQTAIEKRLAHDPVPTWRRLSTIPPDAHSAPVELVVPWDRTRRTIRTPSLSFTTGEQEWAVLPRIGAVLCLGAATSDAPDPLQRALDRWFRLAPDDRPNLDPAGWEVQRGDRFEVLSIHFHPTWPERVPAASPFAIFFGAEEKISGETEIQAVASPLDELYPTGLNLDTEPDPRVQDLSRLLYRDRHPTPVALIGPPGVGKTTLVHSAVRRHTSIRKSHADTGRFPTSRVYHLDPTRVIAGMSRLGQWERRLSAILRFIAKPGDNLPRHALYVDNPVALARVGRSAGSALTLCAVLRPYLERREFPFVLEATPEEWLRLEELERSFTDLFHVERVAPPPKDRVARILITGVRRAEARTGGELPMAALRRLLFLEERYPSPRLPPGGLLDRVDRLLAAGGKVDVAAVDTLVVAGNGLSARMNPNTRLEDAELRAWIADHLIGQPAAAAALADVAHILHAGLARPGKPLATWLLVGPTGVGKTETAKVLTELFYADPDRLIRIDMNEYVDAGAADRLLGGGGREGTLTGRVRGMPYAIVLLDEIEKAHATVHDLLLQLLDEGRLTDGDGRRADFERVVVVLTSNVGAAELARTSGFSRSSGGGYRAAVEATFRPELVNRLDRIIEFHALEFPDIERIAHLQMRSVLSREGFRRRVLLLDADERAVTHLARAGFDSAMGARALKRVIEAAVVRPLADQLASLPLDRPLHLRLQLDDSGPTPRVVTTSTGMRFAAPLAGVELPEADEAAVDAVRALLPDTPFRWEQRPDGSIATEGVRERQIREALNELVPPADTAEPDEWALLDQLQRSRLMRRPRRSAEWKGRSIEWRDMFQFSSAREFFASFDEYHPSHDPSRTRAHRLAILAERTRTLRWAPTSAVLLVERIGGDVTHDDLAEPLAWELVRLFGGTLGCTVPPLKEPHRLPLRIHVDDLPDPAWLHPELGVTIAYPTARHETPAGFRVSAWTVDGAPLPGRPDRSDSIIRVLDGPRLTDLRLGQTLVAGRGAPDLRAWWPYLRSAHE